jgi:hypothetical protein
MAGRAIISRLGVDGHVAGVDLCIPYTLRSGGHDFEIVVAGETRDIVGAGDAHLVLGARTERFEVRERDRPVEQIGPGDVTVGGADAKLVLLEARRRTRPMHRRAANGHADPQRQCWIEIAATNALVEPIQPAEHGPIVIDYVCKRQPRPRLQAHDVDAALGQLVRERPAAGSRTDHDND